MPTASDGTTTIYYEEYGSGYPILLIAPGGLSSMISAWDRAAINPLSVLAEDFRLIAMDQRNAGRSVGPFPTTRPWDAYLDDQLMVMDHLRCPTFHVFGCCIGGPYGLKIAHDAPDRVSAAVLEQPMGMVPENQRGWLERSHLWAANLAESREDLNAEDAARFIDAMWQPEFVSSLTRAEVAEIALPVCVLPGVDEVHPTVIGREIGQLIAGSIVIEPWKGAPEHTEAATKIVRQFLLENTPS